MNDDAVCVDTPCVGEHKLRSGDWRGMVRELEIVKCCTHTTESELGTVGRNAGRVADMYASC